MLKSGKTQCGNHLTVVVAIKGEDRAAGLADVFCGVVVVEPVYPMILHGGDGLAILLYGHRGGLA